MLDGAYCDGKEFSYNLNTPGSDLTSLYEDINNAFISKIINK